MTEQTDKAATFAKLHIKGDPLVLFNIWDAGSAVAVAESGAKAIATGSWGVAAADGFADGENLSLDAAIANLERITASVDLPVTIDFEGGYADDNAGLAENVTRVIRAGAIGINFEDQKVGGVGLFPIEEQQSRIAAIREAAERSGVPLFINARTDIFLKNHASYDEAHLAEAVERSKAYADAGADGFFAPGLRKPEFIRQLTEASPLPVNILVMADTPSNEELATYGVARISYGPGPYKRMIEFLKGIARDVYSPQ
ncbi:MAG: Methylisocitrate lyase [Acidobacteria bacterium OLB17]|nr:MAG: Methylisocitrate lyase [Acidobacteria bacterium OLB17]MCZ2390290.1 isocitrate lyase/phosphoenolpyruvate mutase family protein [Acidobacteriota bacterium]